MPVFRPSCVFNFKITFDESLTIQQAPAPVSVDQVVNSQTLPAVPATEPLVTRMGRPDTSWIYARIPKSASLEFPGYRQAARFHAEFDFRDVAIDPRTIRAAAVEIHLGSVADGEFARGMRGPDQNGVIRSVLQTRNQNGQVNTDTLRMIGMVDEWEVEHNGTSSVIRISGRDLRGILLDTPLNIAPGAAAQIMQTVDWGQPVDAVVAQILGYNSFFAGLTVMTCPDEWPLGAITQGTAQGALLVTHEVPSPGGTSSTPTQRQGSNGRHNARHSGGTGTARASAPGTSSSLSFWDLVTQACYLCGAIPMLKYIGGSPTIVIRPVRNIFAQQNAGRTPFDPTPFAGGSPRSFDEVSHTEISQPLRVRRMVYGRDTLTVSFNRKYGGFQKPRVVHCVSLNPAVRGPGRRVLATWPDHDQPETREARLTRMSAGGQTAQEEIIQVSVPGIASHNQLQQIAKGLYEEIGRGEMGGTVETVNLASFGGDATDPDLLRLQPGDGVELVVDARAVRLAASPLVSTLTDFTRTSFAEAVQLVLDKLGNTPGNANLARVIVATSRGQVNELQRFFRVSTVKFDWSTDGGIKVAFDFQNYIVVRNQVGDQTQPDAAPDAPVRRTIVQPVAGVPGLDSLAQDLLSTADAAAAEALARFGVRTSAS